jgi:hypothetical protein
MSDSRHGVWGIDDRAMAGTGFGGLMIKRLAGTGLEGEGGGTVEGQVETGDRLTFPDNLVK